MSRANEFLAAFLAFLAIASLVAWVSTNPPAKEQFVSLDILGPSNNAALYFPNNNRIVTVNQTPISWNIQVFNHMGSSQLFLLYVLLANKTINGPDASTNTATNRTFASSVLNNTLLQEYHAVLNNDTWNIPLQWSITGRTVSASSVTIHSVIVNGATVPDLDVSGQIADSNSNNFRLVIELWSYDIASHGFLFTYISNKALNSVFNQVWFTVHS